MIRADFICVALGSSLLMAAAPALAQAEQPKEQEKRVDPNEVVCEKQEVLGSRLGSKRVCKTRSEWAEQRRLERQEIEKVQVQRGLKE